MNFLKRLDPRRSLTVRIILVNLTLILLALGGLALWTGLRLQKNIIEESSYELELRTLIVANGLREPVRKQLAYEEETHTENEDDEKKEHQQVFVPFGDRNLKTIVDSYAQEINARVTILDPDLIVRYASDPSTPLHVQEKSPETMAALKGAGRPTVRPDAWTGENRLFVAAPIGNGENPEGVVQLSVPVKAITDRVKAMWLVLITAGLALTFLFVLASIFLGREITRPLLHLTSAANRLAAGDLSTRLEMERQDEIGDLAASFDHMAEQISQLLARERAFVANASHELRTPLTAIQLRAELLQMTIEDSERRTRYLQEIREESEQLGLLLQQLLDMDYAQSVSQTPAEPAAPSPCLKQVTDMMRPLAEDAGLDLQAAIPPDLPPVDIDVRQCEIIIRNLLDNAFKYTPAGGRVDLEATVVDDRVQLIVRDTGMGISEADLPLVFERFYRVESVRGRSGSGLGLALVKNIIDQCGGEIEASSIAGEGTTMIVRLPLAAS